MKTAQAGLLALLFCLSGLAHAQDACVEIQARNGWQPVRLANAPVRVESISGSWTVDRSLSRTGWRGHQGQDAERLAPYSAFKHDADFAFGALLIRARGGDQNFALRPPTAEHDGTLVTLERVDLRINDSDAALGDNEGSLIVCFEEEPRPSPSAPAASAGAARPPVPSRPVSAGSGAVDGAAWMACFNDSRQSDADGAALDRRRAQLRSEERALERRWSDLQDERNHLSYSYSRDEFGIADRARANQERMHQERVARYNADLRALNERLDAYNRQVSQFNGRNTAWRNRCTGMFDASARPLAQQHCVGAAASTAFCEMFQ